MTLSNQTSRCICKCIRIVFLFTSAGVTSLRITPSINSGIPDPVYEIPHSNPNFTSIATIARIHVTGQLPSLLGYRGFSIQLEGLGIYSIVLFTYFCHIHIFAYTCISKIRTQPEYNVRPPPTQMSVHWRADGIPHLDAYWENLDYNVYTFPKQLDVKMKKR